MKEINWNLIGFIKRSQNRMRVLKLLENPKMPSEIGKEMKISLTHASKIVRELNKKKLIFCLNNKLKVGRIYFLTDKGKKVIKKLNDLK